MIWQSIHTHDLSKDSGLPLGDCELLQYLSLMEFARATSEIVSLSNIWTTILHVASRSSSSHSLHSFIRHTSVLVSDVCLIVFSVFGWTLKYVPISNHLCEMVESSCLRVRGVISSSRYPRLTTPESVYRTYGHSKLPKMVCPSNDATWSVTEFHTDMNNVLVTTQ